MDIPLLEGGPFDLLLSYFLNLAPSKITGDSSISSFLELLIAGN
jgi:hypothetical protein